MAGLQVGNVVDNKYEVIRPIGKGGMSRVWLAQDKRLGKFWAVKEIMPNARGSQGAANRQAIIDEANFMKGLDHPAIPRVVDILDTGDTIFVIMDYVNGTSLDRELAEQGGAFEQEEVIDWGIQLCDALNYLHTRPLPVVYRDMKPANVMLSDNGIVKLIDFGISLELEPGAAQSTKRIGSPGYSAPEQVDAEAHKLYPVDQRADVYALGATLYSLVTGHIPTPVVDNGTKTYRFDMRPIREINPQLSDGLEQILIKATQSVPEDRYQTIAEMSHDLEHYEVLTAEYRAAQQNKVKHFMRFVWAAGIAAAVSVVCFVGSFLVRNSSYSSLIDLADAAAATSYEERNVTIDEATGTRTAEASEAEEYYTRAIAVSPDQLEAYQKLIALYKSDYEFTETESARWQEIWGQYGRNVRDNDNIARLYYDTGILYLCYYGEDADVSGVESLDDLRSQRVELERSKGATQWFNSALEVCDATTGNYHGLEVSDDLDEYSALLAYSTIAGFRSKLSENNQEGASSVGTHREYWNALNRALGLSDNTVEVEGDVAARDTLGVIDSATFEQSAPIVQLRLLKIAFNALANPSRLGGFKQAGVNEQQALALLDAILEKAHNLESFVNDEDSDASLARTMLTGIQSKEAQTRSVIENTYHGVDSRTDLIGAGDAVDVMQDEFVDGVSLDSDMYGVQDSIDSSEGDEA